MRCWNEKVQFLSEALLGLNGNRNHHLIAYCINSFSAEKLPKLVDVRQSYSMTISVVFTARRYASAVYAMGLGDYYYTGGFGYVCSEIIRTPVASWLSVVVRVRWWCRQRCWLCRLWVNQLTHDVNELEHQTLTRVLSTNTPQCSWIFMLVNIHRRTWTAHTRPHSVYVHSTGWLDSRVVSVLDSGAVGPGFKSQPRRCQVTVLCKLFTPIVPLFTKQQNW